MSITRIEEMRQERAAAFERLREINDKALEEKRDLSGEESQEFERVEERFNELTSAVERAEKLEGLGPKMTRSIVAPSDEARSIDDEEKAPESLREFVAQRQGVQPQDAPEYRKAFYSWITSKDDRGLSPEEHRTLSKATAGAGLNLVPTSFSRQLIDSLRFYGAMRQLATVITTQSGEALQIPTVTAHGTASWTAENAAISTSDETFGQLTLNAYKVATAILVSEELLDDSAFDLEGYITREFGNRIGVTENTAYAVGDGSAKPTGVATQASAGVTAAGAAAITAADLVGLYHSLGVQYRRNASWVLNDNVVKAVRLLADTTGQYIWQPGLQAGAPDALLGKPVYVDPDVNGTVTTGLITALFGDFSYYWIRDVDGVAFQRLNELYAMNGQVGFRAYHRTDGKLTNTAAIKKLTQA